MVTNYAADAAATATTDAATSIVECQLIPVTFPMFFVVLLLFEARTSKSDSAGIL